MAAEASDAGDGGSTRGRYAKILDLSLTRKLGQNVSRLTAKYECMYTCSNEMARVTESNPNERCRRRRVSFLDYVSASLPRRRPANAPPTYDDAVKNDNGVSNSCLVLSYNNL